MLEENVEKIRTLNPFQTELLKEIFRDQEFNPREYMKPGEKSYTPEQTVRWNLSQIYEKLGVPDDVPNTQKREWVVKEYSEAYEYEFQREEWEAEQASQRLASEPEIFIRPPDPIPVEPEKPLSQSEAQPLHTPRSIPADLQNKVLIDRTELNALRNRAPGEIIALFIFLFWTLGFLLGFLVGLYYETIRAFLANLFN